MPSRASTPTSDALSVDRIGLHHHPAVPAIGAFRELNIMAIFILAVVLVGALAVTRRWGVRASFR